MKSVLKVIDVIAITNPVIGAEFCVLPPELDYGGNVTFLEDCKSLDRWGQDIGFVHASAGTNWFLSLPPRPRSLGFTPWSAALGVAAT